MGLNELTTLVAPPTNPIELGDRCQLDAVEHELGVAFPEDYQDYALKYGSGKFRDESIAIVVFNPCAKVYLERVRHVSRYLMAIKNRHRDRVPYDVFPDLPGILPWGWDVNGNDLFWLVHESTNAWPVVVRAEGYEFQEYALPMTTFLARSMKREIECILWKQEGFFPDPRRIVFEPEELHVE